MPSYLPIALTMEGRTCLVVGGGKVAERRVKSLLEANADILVVAPTVTEVISEMADLSLIRLDRREYAPSDIANAHLIFAATDRTDVNDRVAADARTAGKLVCDSDTPENGDFIVPSTVRRGPMLVSVTTGGSSPALASRVREDILKLYGPEYGPFVKLLGEARSEVLASDVDVSLRADLLRRLANDQLALELVRQNRIEEARERMRQCISSSSG